MRISVKNMVCDRCILAVSRVCADLAIPVREVSLGIIETAGELKDAEKNALETQLNALGFEIINDRETEMVEHVKLALIDMARRDEPSTLKLSAELSERLGADYQTLSRVFSEREGRTVENYFIAQKIERVKELIAYGQQTLSEIAYRCSYSSVAHLSRQFRQVTGMIPTKFASSLKRTPLDKL